MRKMKKINGYLVVRFNDREKREYEGTALGNFGVIDAELYTGILDVDRSVMEYDNAETLEIAVEQTRGLEAELDVEEPETKITVIIEGETEVSEEEIEPESLFQEEREWLEEQLHAGRYAGLTPDTAVHQLTGYAQALKDLGIVDDLDERFMVEPETFGAAPPPDPERREEALAYICDELCKYREGRTQEELNTICENCKAGRWTADPPVLPFLRLEGKKPAPVLPRNKAAECATYRIARDVSKLRDFHKLLELLKEIENYPNGGKPAEPEVKPPQENFRHLAEAGDSFLTRKAFQLGLMIEVGCPENDCTIYHNTFRMARELDKALDNVQGYAAEVLQRELGKHVRELQRMYHENHAVKTFRKEASL